MGKNKDFEKFLYYQLPDGSKVKGVLLFDKNGDPLELGGGGAGSSVSIEQGGNPVGATNPLPTGLYVKDPSGNWVALSPFNALTVRDLSVGGALVNQGSDPNSGQMMLVAGAGWGGTRAIPVNLSGQDDTMTLVPVGGVDQDGKQKTIQMLGNRLIVEFQNASGAIGGGNPLPVYSMNPSTVDEWTNYLGKGVVTFGVSPTGKVTAIRTDADSNIITKSPDLGNTTDAPASTDTESKSLISLFKRQLQKLTALTALLPVSLGQKNKAGSLSVTIASDQDALATTSTQFPSSLGQKTKANSFGVTIASDQDKLNVQTDERPSDTHAPVTISDSVTLGSACRGIYVGVTGDISVYTGTSTTTFKNAMAGTILPVKATRVNATGTTATNLVWLF